MDHSEFYDSNNSLPKSISSLFKFIFLLVVIAGMFSCSSMLGVSDTRISSSPSRSMPSEAGKCYAKCLIQDEVETYEEDLFVYTGQDHTIEGVVQETIIFRHATTRWEKKRSPNCRSTDPNDCLVWCMVDVPEDSQDYYVVTDTSLIKDFKVETVTYSEVIRKGGFTEWKEVVCQSDVTPRLYSEIQLALIEKGFGKDIIADGVISRATKEALVAYQKANGLPVGSLDLETLDSLGVRN